MGERIVALHDAILFRTPSLLRLDPVTLKRILPEDDYQRVQNRPLNSGCGRATTKQVVSGLQYAAQAVFVESFRLLTWDRRR